MPWLSHIRNITDAALVPLNANWTLSLKDSLYSENELAINGLFNENINDDLRNVEQSLKPLIHTNAATLD